MPEEPRPPRVSDLAMAAKLDALADVIKSESKLLSQQIEFTDRNAAQLVRLAEEKLAGVVARVDEHIRAQGEENREIKNQADEDRRTMKEGFEALGRRITGLENFKTKLIGIAIGISLASGGVAGAFVKYVAS